ncbi:hypothetical protein [Kocuria sp.]|uniref:hypothetical protein n=1 Tax=Kocuria sp. TaxID=1871328 RepID=UPI0026DF102F|nr:hypothetical protein [Kocuria sp.]MDO5619316.1 hypothetical protein [Kocuria sp.]
MKPSTRMARLTGTAVLTSSALVACAVPTGPFGTVSADTQPSADTSASPSPEPTSANKRTPARSGSSLSAQDRRALVANLRAALDRTRVDWTATAPLRGSWQVDRNGQPAPTTTASPTTASPQPVVLPETQTVTPPVDSSPTESAVAGSESPQQPQDDPTAVSPGLAPEPVVESAPESAAPTTEQANPPAVEQENPPLVEQMDPPVEQDPASAVSEPAVDLEVDQQPVVDSAEQPASEQAEQGQTAPSSGSNPQADPAESGDLTEPVESAESTDVNDSAAPVPEVDTTQPDESTDSGALVPTQSTPSADTSVEPAATPSAPVAEAPAPESSAPPETPVSEPVQEAPAPAAPAVEPADQSPAEPAGPEAVAPEVVTTPSPTPTPETAPVDGVPAAEGDPESQIDPAGQAESVDESAPLVEAEPVVETVPVVVEPADSGNVTPVSTQSTNSGTDAAAGGSNTDAGRVAYLHGYQQSQAMCPGGSMVGLVDTAIVAPLVAAGVLADGDCTLADMKAANPGTEFLAYLNIGGMAAISQWDQAPFYPSCVDPAYGGEYAVTPNNGQVATNSQGNAIYPAFDYITIADQSESYAQACGERAVAMVTTDSAVGTTGAAPVRFDGVFLDDMAMSPAHGQDMAEIGSWGPWGSDDAYGRAILRTVDTIAGAMETAGSDKTLAGNLGIYSDKQNQVALAQELADSGNLDWIMREFVIGSPTGNQFGAFYAVEQNADVLGELSRSTPVVMHQFAVHATTSPSLTGSVGGQCLLDSTPNAGSLMAQVDQRRQQDMTLSLATILTAKESGTNLDMSLMQAQPECQETAATGSAPYESVTDVSVDESDPAVTNLRAALNDPNVVAVGEKSTWYEYTVWRRDLSDGRQVWVNYRQEAVVIDGVSIPAQSGVITG